MEYRECECLHEANPSPLAGAFNFNVIVLFLPILSSIGIIFNILNIRIFSRRQQSASVYLTALSSSDLGVCLAGIVVISADSLRAYNHFIDQIFVFLLPKTIPLCLFFQMLSVYITVLAAIDCFLSVTRPSGRGLDTISIPILIIFVVLYNFIQFWDLEAVECKNPMTNASMFELCPTEFRLSEGYVTYYKGYLYGLLMAFLPFLLLSTLTVAILIAIRRMRPNDLLHQDLCQPCDGSSPIVLLLVILLFLICNITSLMVNIFEMLRVPLNSDLEALLIDIGNLLVVFNATANFFIYYASDREFAKSLVKMCSQRSEKKIVLSTVHARLDIGYRDEDEDDQLHNTPIFI